MDVLEIASLDEKGQLTLPENLTKYFFKQNIKKFAILSIGDSFTLKPIESNNEAFIRLAQESNEFIAKTKISQEDLPKIIKQVRDEYSH